MVHVARCGLLVVMNVVMVSLNITEAHPVPHDLIVRVYNGVGVAGGELERARRVAEEIYWRAGLRLYWRECRASVRPDKADVDRCADALQPHEVVIRLAVGRMGVHGTALGYALVDGAAQAGTMSTVFVDRVKATAGRLRVERPVLLGRTLAHEIGHLLLGTNSHAERGLMRAWWSGPALHRGGTEWVFSADEARHMTAALAVRVSGAADRSLRAALSTHTSPG